jgi:hypothetical protein
LNKFVGKCFSAVKKKQGGNMKNFVKVLLSLVLLCLPFASAKAHPPSQIDPSYNVQTKIVSADIKHNVSDPQKHYINKVVVYLNKKVIAEKKYTNQVSMTDQLFESLPLDLKAGDIIKIKATCNILGSKTVKLKI